MKANRVIDASITMAWCFLDEATPATRKLLEDMKHTAVLVPGLWYLELVNVLAIAEKNDRIDAVRVAEFIALVESFEVEVDNDAHQRAFVHILSLCRKHKLTSYDAAYLDLALRRKLPLASLDEQMRKVAKKLGIKLLGK